MADTPWWGSMLTGAAGGVLALAGSWINHLLTDRKEARNRKEQQAEATEDRIRDLYVKFIEQRINAIRLGMKILDGVGSPETLREFYDAYHSFSDEAEHTLELLETSKEARKRLKSLPSVEAGRLLTEPISRDEFARITGPWVIGISEFVSWLQSTRFPPTKD